MLYLNIYGKGCCRTAACTPLLQHSWIFGNIRNTLRITNKGNVRKGFNIFSEPFHTMLLKFSFLNNSFYSTILYSNLHQTKNALSIHVTNVGNKRTLHRKHYAPRKSRFCYCLRLHDDAARYRSENTQTHFPRKYTNVLFFKCLTVWGTLTKIETHSGSYKGLFV